MDDQLLRELVAGQKEQTELLRRYLWRLRFSLLGLFLLMTATAIGLGILVYENRPKPSIAIPTLSVSGTTLPSSGTWTPYSGQGRLTLSSSTSLPTGVVTNGATSSFSADGQPTGALSTFGEPDTK